MYIVTTTYRNENAERWPGNSTENRLEERDDECKYVGNDKNEKQLQLGCRLNFLQLSEIRNINVSEWELRRKANIQLA